MTKRIKPALTVAVFLMGAMGNFAQTALARDGGTGHYLESRPNSRIERADSAYRRAVANALRAEAQRARIPIDTSSMLVATRDDILIAIAEVVDNEWQMFTYLALPSDSDLADRVPPDFYILEIMEVGGSLVGRVLDLDGNTVLDGLEASSEESPADAPNVSGLSIELDATSAKPKRWKPDVGQPGAHIVDIITIKF